MLKSTMTKNLNEKKMIMYAYQDYLLLKELKEIKTQQSQHPGSYTPWHPAGTSPSVSVLSSFNGAHMRGAHAHG